MRRQLEGSRQWADEHGYELDTSLRDLGADKELLQKRNKVYELVKKTEPKTLVWKHQKLEKGKCGLA